MVDPLVFFLFQSRREEAIIGPNEKIILCLNQYGSTRTPYSRVNHRNMDGAFGKEAKTGIENEGSGEDIL
jgi:hypothetical protein